MTLKKNLLFLLIAAIGTLYITRWEPSTSEKQDSVLLLSLTPQNISSVSIQQGDFQYSLTRNSDSAAEQIFSSDNPERKLDQSKVKKLLKAIAELRAKNTIPEEKHDAEAYGLDRPPLIVTTTAGEAQHQLIFGEKNSLSGRRYVHVDNKSEIFLVDDFEFDTINKPKVFYYDRQPYTFDTSRVIYVKASGPYVSQSFELVRNPNEAWSLHSPEGLDLELDQSEIASLIEELSALKVSNFVENPTQSVIEKLDRPDLTITISLKTNTLDSPIDLTKPPVTSITFQASKDGQGTFVLRQLGSVDVTVINSRQLSAWHKPLSYFQDKFIMRDIRASSIEKIDIDRSDGRLSIEHEKASENWSITSDGQKRSLNTRTDIEQVRAWLESVTQMQALSFFEPAEIHSEQVGFLKPNLELRFDSSSEPETMLLIIGNPVESDFAPSSENLPKPHYAMLTIGDRQPIMFVMSGSAWQDLTQFVEFLSRAK